MLRQFIYLVFCIALAGAGTCFASDAAQRDFDRAQSLMSEGKSEPALNAFRSFIKKHPASPKAAEAQFRVAEILDSQGSLQRAFDAYQKLITAYPDTPQFERAVAQQIVIANKVLNSRSTGILGIELSSAAERAQPMYETILTNAPQSKYAPISQFNLGLAHERQGNFEKARQAYQAVIDLYPKSTVAPNAQYQLGYLYMRRPTTDASELRQSREAFEDFILDFPESEKAGQARTNFDKLTASSVNDLMNIARFYDKAKKYRAAAIYYSNVIEQYPNTAAAKKARKRIEELQGDLGDDAIRFGGNPEAAAARRKLESQVQSSTLPDYVGPKKSELPSTRGDSIPTDLRTQTRDIEPLEPSLPTQ